MFLNYLNFTFLILFFAFISEIYAAGGRVVLNNEEKQHSASIRKAANFATSEIHLKKLHQGEYDKCTKLENEIISGEKQLVAGFLYSLQLKIKPVAVESDKCIGRPPQDHWKPELCETEILWQAWKEPQMELRRAVCLKIED